MKHYVKTFESFKTDMYKRLNEEEGPDVTKDNKSAWFRYVSAMTYALNNFNTGKNYPSTDKLEAFKKEFIPDFNLTIKFVHRMSEMFKSSPKETFKKMLSILFHANNMTTDSTRLDLDAEDGSLDFYELWDSVSNNNNLSFADIPIDKYYLGTKTDMPLFKVIAKNKDEGFFKKVADSDVQIKNWVKSNFERITSKDRQSPNESIFTAYFGKDLPEVEKNLVILSNDVQDTTTSIATIIKDGKLGPFVSLDWFAHGKFNEKDTKDTADTAKK